MIDIHAHAFNAKYLPLEGIARARRLPKYPAWLLARIIWAVTDDDASRKRFAARWQEIGGEPAAVVALSVDPDVLAPYEEHLDRALAQLNRQVPGRVGPPNDPFLVMLVARDPRRLPEKFYKFLMKCAAKMRDGKALIDWVVLLCRVETDIVDELIETFPAVDVFVHHMMDLGPHYDPEDVPIAFDDLQLNRVRELSRKYPGKLRPFIAYSPHRDNSLDLIKKWRAHGFAGVKFYPPSGYRPLGNKLDDIPEKRRVIPPGEIDRRNRALFAFCASEGVPIFAHCQPGEFQAWPDAGLLSHPAGWVPVIEQFKNLRLCLGHAGGEQWAAREAGTPEAEGFVRAAIELTRTSESVYCEFGCLDSLLDDPAAPVNFQKRLVKAVSASPKFGERIMYGSDWHMLAKSHNAHEYPDKFRKVFEHPALAQFTDGFFEGNARRFLNL
jgi:predicted TIM-barrel fold metal-dependent hydrolase